MTTPKPKNITKSEEWDFKNGNNWKGELAGKPAKHQYLYHHYGRPQACENPFCSGRSKIYEWCLKPGRTYSHNRSDYFRYCRSCHRKLDKIYPPPFKGHHQSASAREKIRQFVLTRKKIGNRDEALAIIIKIVTEWKPMATFSKK